MYTSLFFVMWIMKNTKALNKENRKYEMLRLVATLATKSS